MKLQEKQILSLTRRIVGDTNMKYDADNDRLISEKEEIKIYPSSYNFPRSRSVEIEINHEFLSVRKELLRDLADGLLNAADRLGV